MNPNLARVVLRPRGPLEVFDLAWRFMRVNWAPQVRMLALCWLPLVILGGLGAALTRGNAWMLVFPLLVGPALQAPFTVLTGRLLFDSEVKISAVLRETWARLPAWTGAALVGASHWLVGLLTCLYGLLPLQATTLYLPEVVILEKLGLSRGIERSIRLAGGNAGVALLGAASRWGLTLWLGLVGEATGQALFSWVFQLGTPFGTLATGQITPFLLGGVLLSHPIFAVYRLFLYVDVRTRNEGWDLQVGLRAAGMSG